MPNNFVKRKAKETAKTEAPEVVEVPTNNEDLIEVEPEYPQKGYDIYTLNGGRAYFVAEIEYNAETGAARVTGSKPISRLVALKYENQKTALGILKR